jgi:hypothetical protein
MRKIRTRALSSTPTIQVIERMFSPSSTFWLRAKKQFRSRKSAKKPACIPSTTHRILNDLATGRFVDRPEAGNYRLGMRLLELGNLVKESFERP